MPLKPPKPTIAWPIGPGRTRAHRASAALRHTPATGLPIARPPALLAPRAPARGARAARAHSFARYVARALSYTTPQCNSLLGHLREGHRARVGCLLGGLRGAPNLPRSRHGITDLLALAPNPIPPSCKGRNAKLTPRRQTLQFGRSSERLP